MNQKNQWKTEKVILKYIIEKKIEKKNENRGIESIGLIDGESPVVKYTTQHQNTLKKLREIYENIIKEFENSFF